MTYGNDDFVPIILGTNLNAYNMARSLHEAFGVRSLALGRFPLRETARSAIVDVRSYRDFNRPEFIVETLSGLTTEFPGRRVLLIPNIEFYANVLMSHRERLAEFTIPLPEPGLARRLMNKATFARVCAEFDVPHPATIVIGRQDVDATLGRELPFPYPAILKPADTDSYPRIPFEGKQKVYRVADATELRNIAERIYAAGYTEDLVVQEYLDGEETVMRVANSYSDQHGRVRLLSLGQVALAERDPRWAGNYNAVITTHDDAVTGAIRRLLDGVGYVGAANCDVMYDSRTESWRILEVNLRLGACSYYTMAAGANLTRCYVDELIYGQEVAELTTTTERLWVNMPYLAAIAFTPRPLRARVRRAARNGVVHTLRYRADRSPARLANVARIDLRHTLDYVKYARVRLNR